MKYLSLKKFISLFLIAILVFSNFSSSLIPVVSAAENETKIQEDLIISEYIEGSSYNKAIELYNGTGSTIDLSNYSLEVYSNGKEEVGSRLDLEGNLPNGEVLVIAHTSASEEIKNVADVLNGGVTNFNGDDAIVLKQTDSIIDSIGRVGEDPGSSWESEGVSTLDETLVRKESVVSGDTDVTDDYAPSTEWNSFEKDTFEFLGSYGDNPVDEPEEPTVPEEVTDIADVREMADGQLAMVEGIVLASPSSIGNGQYSTYIQDDTGGINLFAYDQGDFPTLEKGDKVKVSGELETYNGLKEIVPTSVEVIDSGQVLPDPKSITLADMQDSAIAEGYEGELVHINGYISNIPDSPAGGGYNISLVDEDFNSTTLRVMEGSLDIAAIEEGKWYDVTAIMSQYTSYQLIPTEASDIKLADEQPEAPTAAGVYTSTVMYVSDGDTIRLNTPVLGADRVRFVNIDTPETSVAGANGVDEANQKEHGYAATENLKQLLPEGSTVTLKIGEEATDAYGRLLAQVINEKGVNTNLEQVKQGYAVSYFIWPVGDENEYAEYQAATREALDNELGIWNPESPLKELPFEYRAITEGGDFGRYVGNSDTKEYVAPLEWAEVPVDKRIFFASVEEAEAQGYTAVEDEGSEPVDPPSDDILEIQLLSMNDLHGKIDQEYDLDIDGDGEVDGTYGRMDYTSAYIKDREQDNENTLIVHAGDMIGGSSPVSGLYQDEPTVEIMEEIGFDFGTVGNHEFDEGTTELLRMVNGGEHPDGLGTEGYDGIDFDNLCANCVYKDSGETILDAYAIQEIDGEEIGFIGVNTQASATMVMPAGIEDIEFTDETAAVNKAAAELQDQGVEAIVVLAHMPADQDGASATGDAADLANNVNDAVDIIFAAHNHQVVDAVVDNKLIVQASEYGKAFADIDIEIDRETGDIVTKEAEIVFVDQSAMEPDAAVTEILEKYDDLIADKMNEVLGYNANTMTGSYSNDGDHGLGNLIADAMLYSMDSDFSLMNGGGIRDQLLAGEVTWGNLYNVMPFGNTLMKVEVTGADMYEIINEQLSPQYGPDYSVGGMKYTWDTSTNEAIDIMFMDGTPIDEDETYTLTVNNYMGTSEGPIKDLGMNVEMGPVDLDSFVDYVKSLESTEANPIDYAAEGRIVAVDNGSDEELGEVTIAEARNAEAGTVVTVEGIVTTTPGAWGSNGFYMQDETGGTYVYGDDSVSIGDIVTFTAEAASYSGEFQLSSVTNLEITGTTDVPNPIELSPSAINDSNQGQLVSLKGVTISGLEEVNSYGTFEFTASKDGESILVRVDNRTGLVYDEFGFEDGDIIDLTGISSIFNETYQLKITSPTDVSEYVPGEEEPTEPTEPTEPEEDQADEAGNVTTKPTVTDGKATISVDAVENVEENGKVIIELNEEDEIEVSLTSAQIAMLKAKNASITIQTKQTTVTIPASVFGDGDTTVDVVAVDSLMVNGEAAISGIFDFTITSNGVVISEFAEDVTLQFNVDDDKVSNPEDVKLYYYNPETSEWELIGGTYQDGMLTAITTHFSIFTVFELAAVPPTPVDPPEEEPINPEEEPTNPEEDGSDNGENEGSENSDDTDTGDTDENEETATATSSDDDETSLPETATSIFNMLLMGAMLLLAGFGFYLYQKRRVLE
ncbi:5'-nucleotidase C-terminal domain-containing protein [Paraliobacillus sp. X-1268]|uniref:5'-nucleotidase C-terminal domain-containing protein n=1 Tax=Paraliobacillus sp. X-1268 TaxID=2213193 RepID=UPI000E3B5857|nr:5'-nucleotidase C-terminal domain-containing protein [Paraliobacillus sp. X-1268]